MKGDRVGDGIHALIVVEHPADVAAFGAIVAHRIDAVAEAIDAKVNRVYQIYDKML